MRPKSNIERKLKDMGFNWHKTNISKWKANNIFSSWTLVFLFEYLYFCKSPVRIFQVSRILKFKPKIK
jgi:hypothetical protein